MVIGILFLVLATSLLVTGALQGTDRIRPNSVVGLRTQATSRSEAAWYAGNRKTAPYLLILAAVWELSGLLIFVLTDDNLELIALVTVGLSVPLFAAAIVMGNRAAMAAHQQALAENPERSES